MSANTTSFQVDIDGVDARAAATDLLAQPGVHGELQPGGEDQKDFVSTTPPPSLA